MSEGRKFQIWLGALFLLICILAIVLYAFHLNSWGFFAGLSGFGIGGLYHICETLGMFDGTAEVDDGTQK